jgi:hypothetical protein
MARGACVSAVVLTIMATALCVGTTGRATPNAGAVCKSFSVSGSKVLWSAIGNVTCAEAKPWLLKLLADHGKPGARVVLNNGPKGFHCTASDDSKGRPAAGSCYTGTIAFPKNGFQWLT